MNETSTRLAGGVVISGMADSADQPTPEPTDDGFPSQWHRDRYISDLRRNITDADQQLQNTGLSEARKAVFDAEKRSAVAELERLGESVDNAKPKR